MVNVDTSLQLEKNLNSSLPLGKVSLRYCLNNLGKSQFFSFSDLMADNLPDSLPIKQVGMKRCLRRRRVYLMPCPYKVMLII